MKKYTKPGKKLVVTGKKVRVTSDGVVLVTCRLCEKEFTLQQIGFRRMEPKDDTLRPQARCGPCRNKKK